MNQIENDFSNISCHSEMATFIEKYRLMKQDEISQGNITHYTFADGSLAVNLSHRWYDRSQVYAIRPDVNELVLTVKNGSGDTIISAKTRYLQD